MALTDGRQHGLFFRAGAQRRQAVEAGLSALTGGEHLVQRVDIPPRWRAAQYWYTWRDSAFSVNKVWLMAQFCGVHIRHPLGRRLHALTAQPAQGQYNQQNQQQTPKPRPTRQTNLPRTAALIPAPFVDPYCVNFGKLS